MENISKAQEGSVDLCFLKNFLQSFVWWT